MATPVRPDWIDPLDIPPPRGRKLNVLTYGGIATEGFWDDKLYVGWLPLANTPDKLKYRMLLWATGRKEELNRILGRI